VYRICSQMFCIESASQHNVRDNQVAAERVDMKKDDESATLVDRVVMLTFDDALSIAKGCFDYSGGHRDEAMDVFHHGIQTVINALEGAKQSGLSDLQSNVLHRIGQSK
ncbi:MAG: hypothetical protein ACKO0N_03340, partial [Planctomycetota bacterium]